MRNVAVIAFGRLVMARFRPGVILFPHDMAIHARFGIVAQIRKPLRIIQRKKADTGSNTDRQAGQNFNFDKSPDLHPLQY
jgi:hypothetical protein